MFHKSSAVSIWLIPLLVLAGGIGIGLLAAIPLWLGPDFLPRHAQQPKATTQSPLTGNEPEPLGEQAKNMFDLANVELDKARDHLEKAGKYKLYDKMEAVCPEYINASDDARRADFFVNVEYVAYEIQEKRPEILEEIRNLRSKVIAPSVAICDKFGYSKSAG